MYYQAPWVIMVDKYLYIYTEIQFFPEDVPLDSTPPDQKSQRGQMCGCSNIISCNSCHLYKVHPEALGHLS